MKNTDRLPGLLFIMQTSAGKNISNFLNQKTKFDGTGLRTPSEIPYDVLRKAAESQLITSIAGLGSPTSKVPTAHKIVLDLTDSSTYDSSVFVKTIPNTLPSLQRESKLYDFLKSVKHATPFLPRCYLTHETSEATMIFLENLKNSEFQNYDFEDNLDFSHALLGMETLAKFHATCYNVIRSAGTKAKGRMELQRTHPWLKITPFLNPSSEEELKMSQITGKVFEDVVLRILEEEAPSIAFKLRRKITPLKIYDRIKEILEDEKHENDDLYVITHGDYRLANVLFKYSGAEPVECKIVDFKFSQLAPMASDIAYFLLSSTTFTLRNEYEEKLLAHYCDMFDEQLQKIRFHGEFDIEEFHRQLELQYRRMVEFAFFAAGVITLPLTLCGLPCTSSSLLSLEDSGAFQRFASQALANSDLQRKLCDAAKDLARVKAI